MIGRLRARRAPYSRLRRAGLAVLVMVPFAGTAPAAAESPCREVDTSMPRAAAWSPPLDRVVPVRSRGEPLGEVLKRVADASGVRLSYSSETVPLDRPICVALTGAALGDVLRHLLDGVAVVPVAVGPTHVVLSPIPPETRAIGGAPPIHEIQDVLVTGTPDAVRPGVPHSVWVIDGSELQRFGNLGLAHALNALVPGFRSWGTAGGGALGGLAGMRGASSFRRTVPKVYLDGIEIADPSLLTHLAPDALERVEVIQGPQGAALYGANASGGVIHLVSRRDAPEPGAASAELRSYAAIARGGSTPNESLVHRHALSVRHGTERSWLRATLAAGGDDGSEGTSRAHFGGIGTGRLVWGSSVLTVTSRLQLEPYGTSPVPNGIGMARLSSPAQDRPGAEGWVGRAPSTQYTLGATFDLLPDERWSHKLVAGIDGYRGRNVPTAHGTDASDTPAFAGHADPGADRLTLRLSSTADLPARDGIAASLTFAAEHLVRRDPAAAGLAAVGYSGEFADVRTPTGAWQRSTGVSGAANLGIAETLLLSGGLRVESATHGAPVALPQLGGSVVMGGDLWTLELRTAFGRAMRDRTGPEPGRFTQTPTLVGGFDPEMQEGIEAGVRFRLARALSLDLTRFAQSATNLTQGAFVDAAGAASRDDPSRARYGAVRPNAGEIANRGWELQARVNHGDLALTASAAAVDSRVVALPGGYAGNLREGDRMPLVPAQTLGIVGSWDRGAWTLTLGLTRAWDWIGYAHEHRSTELERDAASRVSAQHEPRHPWATYDGGLGVDASVGFQPIARLGIGLGVDNLFDSDLGGPDGPASYPGRTLGLELRVRF